MTKLVLGTAQFGTGYGITSQVDRISDVELRSILRIADDRMELFDTSPDYGDAQARLGALRKPTSAPRYISKFALPLGSVPPTPAGMYLDTLADLGASQLYGLLFHRVGDLRDDRSALAWRYLLKARDDGLIARIGASIYDLDDLKIVEDRFPGFDLLQIPGNILDRRLLDSPALKRLHDKGVEVHVRSAYLQGLLLSTPDSLPMYFGALGRSLEKLRDSADFHQVSVMDMALSFLKNHYAVDAVLVGATSAAELDITLESWTSGTEGSFSFNPPHLPDNQLDPRLWPSRKQQS